MDEIFEARRISLEAKLVRTAMDISAHLSCAGFSIPVPGTTPTLYVMMGMTTVIAPPVAEGSVDTKEFCALLEFYGRMYPQGNMARTAQAKAAIIGSIAAWGAQQRDAGYASGRIDAECAELASTVKMRQRAEKAEAALAVEIERVQDYYTRWRCERENPTNTHRLDTWQAACGKARAERDKAEARVKELEEDAMRWRYLRDLDHDLTGTPGQPCVAIPDGASSGHYATGKDAVIAVDRAMGKSS